jgi:hypothetical protein
MIKDDPFFEDIGLLVDVFHSTVSTHRATRTASKIATLQIILNF